MKTCDHKGYEYLHSKVRQNGRTIRRNWKCALCRMSILPPRQSKSERIVYAFKRGLSRRQVARKFRVKIARVDQAIRKALR